MISMVLPVQLIARGVSPMLGAFGMGALKSQRAGAPRVDHDRVGAKV